MPAKIIYERFLWFHNRIRAGSFPNARTLSEHFEVSHKTAQRNIEFMHERLRAPLCYVRSRRGYTYEDNTYELPGLWLSEDELISLLVSYRVATLIPDHELKASMKAFLDHILALLGTAGKVSIKDLNEKVSVKNIEYSRTSGKTFHFVLDHLLRNKPLRIEYYSPHNDESTIRDVLPIHLLHYMGSWHLIAHCTLRDELRYFTLSRIRSIRASDADLSIGPAIASVKEYIRQNFGIMASPETREVCLHFSEDIAPWVAEQVWHPAQKADHRPDGTLCLTLPVADLREIRREVLKYGSQVEVISPEALRIEVMQEIRKMKAIYDCAEHQR